MLVLATTEVDRQKSPARQLAVVYCNFLKNRVVPSDKLSILL